MGLLFRSLLIWLLVLALPAQGAAVARMISCGPGHHGAAAASQAQTAAADHHGQLGVPAGGHDHLAMASPAGAAGANESSPAQPAPADSHKCSVCASCCSAGAILNTLPRVPEPGIASTVFAAVPAAIDTFAVDGPDRPPRAWLA